MDVDHSIIGFRVWRTGCSQDNPALLASTNTRYFWTPGINQAYCKLPVSMHTPQSIPTDACRCGLYALHQWYPEIIPSTPGLAHGIVRGWGQVRSHHDGWRAQYAEVTAIVDTGIKRAPAIAECYGVPLVSIQAMPAIASEFGKVVPPELRPDPKRSEPTTGEVVRDTLIGVINLTIQGTQALWKSRPRQT